MTGDKQVGIYICRVTVRQIVPDILHHFVTWNGKNRRWLNPVNFLLLMLLSVP